MKRSKPYLTNHRLYNPNKEKWREDYFYSLLLLLVLFRSEAELVNEGETADHAFSYSNSANSSIRLHHKKFEQMLKAQENVKCIGNVRQEEAKDTTDKDKYSELGPRIVGKAKSSIEDLQDL